MIYQYDQALPLPTKDLYDTQVMQMAVAAAKDMYEKGEKRIDDFYNKYEDFYSPVAGATEDVYNEGIGKIKNIISDLYNKGIDPLRSNEGRALVAQAIRNVNVAKINARRQEAELAKQYLKNRDTAIMNGTYDPDVERAINGGKLFEEFTAADGYWKSTAPVRYMSQDDMIAPLAKALNPEFDAVRTAQENNGYDYKTVSEDRIRQMVNDNIDDLITKSTMGQYYYNQALKQAGDNPQLAKQILAEQYVQAAKKYTKEDREINQYTYQKMLSDERRKAAAEDDARAMNQMRERLKLEYQYKDLENYDYNGNGKLDENELSDKKRVKEAQIQKMLNTGRRRDADGYPNVFDEADNKPGEYIEYNKQYGYENKISPASGKIKRVGSQYNDEAKKEINYPNWYKINAGDMKSLVNSGYITSDSDSGKKLIAGEFSQDVTFEADGFIIKKPIYVKNKDGKTVKQYRYYMSGQLAQNGATLTPKNAKAPTVLVLINERDANYAEQQKKDRSVDTTN